VFENAELMQLMIPTLKADFAVCGSYVYTSDRPLDCLISVFGGLQGAETSRAKQDFKGSSL
jgi:medium-chain acyl-[acyl-carrier-protein] hydrolase